jgi:hypothetical protein
MANLFITRTWGKKNVLIEIIEKKKKCRLHRLLVTFGNRYNYVWPIKRIGEDDAMAYNGKHNCWNF